MAEKIGGVYYEIEGRDKDLQDALTRSKKSIQGLDKDFSKSQKSLTSGFNKIGVAAAVGFGAISLAAAKAIKSASDLNEQSSKFRITFAGVTEEAEKASQALVDSYGLSTRESKEFLSTTGDLVKGLGFSSSATLELSTELNKLAVDVTSFKNVQGGVEQTTRAFNSAILGEREALKSLGFSITEAEVKQVLFEKGQDKLTGSALRQAKALATVELITKKNADAVGDFSRTADGAANVMRRVASRTEDLFATMGQQLTPSVERLGAAFLQATRKGGILTKGLAIIGKAISKVIDGVSNLIDTFNLMSDQNAAELQAAQAEKLKDKMIELKNEGKRNTEEYKKLEKQFIATINSSLDSSRKSVDAANRIEKSWADVGDELKNLEKDVKKADLKLPPLKPRASKEFVKEADRFHKEALKEEEGFYLNGIAQAQAAAMRREEVIDDAQKRGIITEQRANELRALNRAKAEQKITDIVKKEEEDRNKAIISGYQSAAGAVTNLIGQLSSIVSQQLSIALGNIDEQLQTTLAAIDEQTQAQLEAAGLLEESQQEKLESEIEMLNEQLARTNSIKDKNRLRDQIKEKKKEADKLKIEAEAQKQREATEAAFEAEKRKRQREAAKTQKQLAIAETLINIPTAALSAFKAMAGIPYVGPALGTAAAIAATALGLKQLQLIQSTPLPALAHGGIAQPANGGQQVVVAEAGTQEAILPLSADVLGQLGAAIAENSSQAGPMALTINIGGETLYAIINKGVEDGHVIINESDLAVG